MKAYKISEEEVEKALKFPERQVEGYRGRLIAEKSLNDHILRVVYEKKGKK